MNRKVLLTTLGLGISLFALSSYQNGPAHGGAGNRSGSNNSPSCAASGCHGPESTNLALTLTLTDNATNAVVTDGKYIPGHTYIASLVGVYSGTASYDHLGFQASVVNAGNTNSGTLAVNVASTGTSTNGTGGITVIEHTAPLAKTGSQFITSFKWTAPAAGSGDARIYARMLANNFNGISDDDTPNSIMSTFSEAATTGIHEVANNNLFQIYPNPASGRINVKPAQSKAGKYDVSITGIDGKIVMSSTVNFNGTEIPVDISGFAKGIYTLSLHNQDGYQVTRFVKQ